MTGYNCKYVPIELLHGFGVNATLINDTVEQFNYANTALHPNLCAHAKAVLEDIHQNKYDEILFTNCCDSARKVFDVAAKEGISFAYLFDVPSCTQSCAVEKLARDLMEFIQKYEKDSGRSFDVQRFLQSFQKDSACLAPTNEKFVALLGARSNDALKHVIAKNIHTKTLDFTCAQNRSVMPIEVENDELLESIMKKYAKSLLSQMPCMRMQDHRARHALYESENCVGIIYHTIQFCDYYSFEYAQLKQLNKPILKIETDFTKQAYGQLLTRLEGFNETIRQESKKTAKKTGTVSKKYFAGIDSGSTSTELVILDSEKNLVQAVAVKTGANASASAKKALAQCGVPLQDIACIVATGYGRKNIAFANRDITEITCHAKGAKYLYNDTTAIIDIGGQDSKVIALDAEGHVTNFVMNDKCAAGTGRFLENMAKVLELNMEEMAQIGLVYKNDLTISSMCTVFAESEVVSLIAENRPIADIVHGLNKSVAIKAKALASMLKSSDCILMTGGVANNRGVVRELEKQMGQTIHVPQRPEFCGAIGAALFAMEA